MGKAEVILANPPNSDDKPGKINKQIRDIQHGQYFGEISYLYKTCTSATVTAVNYSTIGLLEHEKADELFDIVCPEYKKHVEDNIMKNYHDEQREFLLKALRRIDYL